MSFALQCLVGFGSDFEITGKLTQMIDYDKFGETV
jgi:hypothetical protein